MTENKITNGNITQRLLSFFFPIMIGSFFQQLYNTVDSVVVGNYVSSDALRAVGGTSQVVNLLVGFFIGLASGATVVISQYYGASDKNGIKKEQAHIESVLYKLNLNQPCFFCELTMFA